MKKCTNLSRLVDVSGHDAHLTAERVDHTWAVRAHEARPGLRSESLRDLDLVRLRDTLRDANNEADFILDGLKNGVGGERRWHVKDGGVGPGLLDCLKVKYCQDIVKTT
jgi:hypothetical protein